MASCPKPGCTNEFILIILCIILIVFSALSLIGQKVAFALIGGIITGFFGIICVFFMIRFLFIIFLVMLVLLLAIAIIVAVYFLITSNVAAVVFSILTGIVVLLCAFYGYRIWKKLGTPASVA